jgi:hypothetical protein
MKTATPVHEESPGAPHERHAAQRGAWLAWGEEVNRLPPIF